MKTSKKYVRVFAGAVCAAVMMSGAVVSAETFATVKGGGLNLRETASLDARVLGQYPTGTWITILEKGDTWHKVTVDGKTGYMMNKYLNENAGHHVRPYQHRYRPEPAHQARHGRCDHHVL